MRRQFIILGAALALPLFVGCQSHQAERYADTYERSQLGWVRAHHGWFPDWRPPMPNAPLREPQPIFTLKDGAAGRLVPPPVANSAVAKTAMTPTAARPAMPSATAIAPASKITVAPLPIATSTVPVTAPRAVRIAPPTRPATPPAPTFAHPRIPVAPAMRPSAPATQNGLPRAIVDDRRRVTESSPPAVTQPFAIINAGNVGGSYSQPSTMREHVVRKGETLTQIARKYYGDPNEWRRISRANSGQLKSPTAIQAGMKLRIP
jgi:nucleoid-associated protein YgaU